jgi:hypothetical protein
MTRTRLIAHAFPVAGNIYNRAVMLLYGTRDQINRALIAACQDEREVAMEPSSIGRWVCYRHDDGLETDFLCVVRRSDRNEAMAVLSHEALHHTAHALRNAGMEFTEATEEAYCYYHGWILRQCLAVITRRTTPARRPVSRGKKR